jgi:hypothetical protein
MQLVGTNTFLAGSDQENSLEPEAQRDMRGLEDRPDLDGERLAAVVALVNADPRGLPCERPVALDAAAMRADRAARPNARFDEAIGGFFVVEVRGFEDLRHAFSPVVREA